MVLLTQSQYVQVYVFGQGGAFFYEAFGEVFSLLKVSDIPALHVGFEYRNPMQFLQESVHRLLLVCSRY